MVPYFSNTLHVRVNDHAYRMPAKFSTDNGIGVYDFLTNRHKNDESEKYSGMPTQWAFAHLRILSKEIELYSDLSRAGLCARDDQVTRHLDHTTTHHNENPLNFHHNYNL